MYKRVECLSVCLRCLTDHQQLLSRLLTNARDGPIATGCSEVVLLRMVISTVSTMGCFRKSLVECIV